jgi:hypothetical protein
MRIQSAFNRRQGRVGGAIDVCARSAYRCISSGSITLFTISNGDFSRLGLRGGEFRADPLNWHEHARSLGGNARINSRTN